MSLLCFMSCFGMVWVLFGISHQVLYYCWCNFRWIRPLFGVSLSIHKEFSSWMYYKVFWLLFFVQSEFIWCYFSFHLVFFPSFTCIILVYFVWKVLMVGNLFTHNCIRISFIADLKHSKHVLLFISIYVRLVIYVPLDFFR